VDKAGLLYGPVGANLVGVPGSSPFIAAIESDLRVHHDRWRLWIDKVARARVRELQDRYLDEANKTFATIQTMEAQLRAFEVEA